MNASSNKGFSAISTLLFMSLLLGLGGAGAGGTLAYKQLHPEDFRNQLKTVLGEPLTTILGLTPESIDLAGIPTPAPTPTPDPQETVPTPETTVTPGLTQLKIRLGINGEDDASEQESDQEEHGTGATGITSSVLSGKRGDDHE